MGNNHRTYVRSHPGQSLLEIYTKSLSDRISAVQDAPGISSLSGRGPEASTYDYDADIKASEAQLMIGRVVNYWPFEGVYRVQLDGKRTEVACIDDLGRGLPFSASRSGAYPANSRVIVFYRGVIEKSIIIGSVPDLASARRRFSVNGLYAHANHMWHRIGYRKDLYHARMNDAFDVEYYGDGRPPDSPALGDFNVNNFSGGLISLTMWQLVLRSTNGCGIWMNLLDELMRLVAKNLQVWTPSGQINKYAAGGETFNYDAQALYDWEGLGLLRKPEGLDSWMEFDGTRSDDALRHRDGENTYRTAIEPVGGEAGEKMHPFFRFEKFSGYYGHGGTLGVKALPKTGGKINYMDQPLETVQTFRQSVNVSGTYNLQAAGGFSLERTVNMPCYWQKYEPFDEDGDIGKEGAVYLGHTHNKVATLKEAEALPESLTKSVAKQLGAVDYHAREKYKPIYVFAGHEEAAGGRDYKRVDPETVRKSQPLTGLLNDLRSQQFVADLETISASTELDGSETEYVTRTSGIYATQDGGFLIRDAYGNEIRTGANGIEFNSISDVTTLAHRRVVSISGDDTVVTANKSMDLTAVQNDLRLQAFNNLEAVSGVSGQGRTLIENRGIGEFAAWTPDEQAGEDIAGSGIYLVAKKSSAVTYATSSFSRYTGNTYSECANNWSTASQVYEIKAGQCAELLVGQKDVQNSRAGIVVEGYRTVVLSGLYAANSLYVDQQLAVGGQAFVKQGLSVVGNACMGGSMVLAGAVREGDSSVLRDDEDERNKGCAVRAREYVEAQAGHIEDVDAETADKLYDTANALYEEEQVGNAATVARSGFSGRTQKQMGSENFLFVMPAYVTSGEAGKMDEFALDKYYAKLDDEEGPFPGKTRWAQECCVVPVSAYEGKDPFTLADQDQVETYAVPELARPSEVFSALVLP